jgi:hypothetical protein
MECDDEEIKQEGWPSGQKSSEDENEAIHRFLLKSQNFTSNSA